MIIDGEDFHLTFDGENVIVTESVPEAIRSDAVENVQSAYEYEHESGYTYTSIGKTVTEDVAESVKYEAFFM